MWTPNRYYRVCVLPSELVLLRAGSSAGEAAAAGAQFGLIGALFVAAANPAQKNQKRREELDNSSLDDLIDDHKHNFRVGVWEIDKASLDPTSFWLAGVYGEQNIGVFRFAHASRGQVRLAFSSADDLKTAFETLPAVLGEKLTVNIEWNEKKNRFVRKK
jgi:hypothetical protein